MNLVIMKDCWRFRIFDFKSPKWYFLINDIVIL